jgi:hypothetical protein
MPYYLKIFVALFIVTVVSSTGTYDLKRSNYAGQNTTTIQKTNPYWPAKGMVSVDPCSYGNCTNV